MTVEPEYLPGYYATLSDETLLAMNRADLVAAAQKCLDDQLHKRGLTPRASARRFDEPDVIPRPQDIADGAPPPEDKPRWLEEAAEAFSAVDSAGTTMAHEISEARQVLEAAGIPCYLEILETPEKERVITYSKHRWRLLVPGNLGLRAGSVLDRDIFNPDFDARWKAHLQTLSDEEVRAMAPRVVFCGLFDRVERTTRTYDEELTRRGIK
jgi:hypothetical protein